MKIAALRALGTSAALEQASKLDAAARKQLFIDCPAADHRILLVLNVLEKQHMDDGFAAGISRADYDAVRLFLVRQRDKMTSADKKRLAQNDTWNHWFFPEYRRIGDVRERFVRVAMDHVDLASSDSSQINLFSLNGYFGWQHAKNSAHTWTTCGLFVRACRAAARMLESGSWATNTPRGTDPCIVGPGNNAIVPYKSRGSREPRRGDIFHVNSDGKTNAHVGIIVKHERDADGNWRWRTVEGGQREGYTTLMFDRDIVLKNGRHWHGTGANQRPLVKWIDLDLLAASIP